jgi:hypothetical protein
MVDPSLWCWDVDDDGQDEAVVVDYAGGGTGVSIYELHVIEKGADGTLTDYGFPQSLWEEDTTPLLSLATVEDRAYVVLGRELVDITDMTKDEEGDVGLSAVYPGQYIYFDGNFNADWPNDSAIRLQGGVGADTRYAYVYVANVVAAVTYHDGVFTLSEFHLNSYS